MLKFFISKGEKMADFRPLTTTSGRPIGDNQNVMSVGPRGPLLLQDTWYLEKLAAFDRENPRARSACTRKWRTRRI